MSDLFKLDSCFYKPLKSASAVSNAQPAIHAGSAFHEDHTKRAKSSLDGTDIRNARKSADHAGGGWHNRLGGRYSRDDLGLNHRPRLEDRLSVCRLDEWKDGPSPSSHGPLCKCTHSARPAVDKTLQDLVERRRSLMEKVSSFPGRRSDDYRDCSADWNHPVVEPFPRMQFESSGIHDVPGLLRKTNFDDECQRQQRSSSHDALLSAVSVKLDTQSKIIEKLHNGLKRLEDERDAYTQLFRELRDEMISLNGQIVETQTNSSLHRDLGVWKHQIVTEMNHLEANVNRFHNQGKDDAAEHSSRVAELRHELSEIKKFLSDEAEATRREIRKLHSRIGQLEVDMVGVLSENKDLHRGLQRLEKGVHSVVQSESFLSRDLRKTQNQQTKDRTDLKQLQSSYGCLLQKLNALTLKTTCMGKQRIPKDITSASLLRTTDPKQKTGRKSRSRRMKSKSLDYVDLDLNATTSESSSLTSLTDVTSTCKDKLADGCCGKESSVSGTVKATKVERNSKRVTKKGGSSKSLSPLMDMETSDSLAEIKVRPAASAAVDDRVAAAVPAVRIHHPMVHKPMVHKPMVHKPMVHKPMVLKPMVHKPRPSGPSLEKVEASARYYSTTSTATTGSSSSSSSSSSCSSSSSSSASSSSSSSASSSDLTSPSTSLDKC